MTLPAASLTEGVPHQTC